MKESFKIIIDTDPGIDDTNALVYLLNDPQFDIKLITVAYGNISIKNACRNMCHILDIFNKDIPVIKGYEERMSGSVEDASFLHTKEGLGGYKPPKTTKHKPVETDPADAVYEIIKKYPKEITFIVLGPHTTIAHVLQKYPDSKDLIKEVVMMGGAPSGIKTNPNHNSFNIRIDAPAFKETIDSKLPVLMCPSRIVRDVGYFTKKEVEKIEKTNIIGKFLAKTFETYWEPEYKKKIIATNDICAIYYLVYPKLYKTKTANIDVDTEKNIGKIIAEYTKNGQFKIVVNLKRRKFHKILFKKLKEMSNIEITDKTFLKNVK